MYIILQRRFLAAFGEIQDISYEAELMSRGKVILDFRNNLPVCEHVHYVYICVVAISQATSIFSVLICLLTMQLAKNFD